MNLDFYPNGLTPIDVIRTVDVSYKVSKERPEVELEFSSDSRAMATVFGATSADPIILDEKSVRRLPHNLVQCCLTNLAEGEDVGSFTPDIVIHSDSGLDIIEIATRQTLDDGVLAAAVSGKCNKYFRLIEMGLVRKIQIIAVGPQQVMCISGRFEHPNAIALKMAYRKGIEILNSFQAQWGYFSEEDSDDRMSSCLDGFRSIEIVDIPGGLDPSCLTSPLIPNNLFQMGTGTYEKHLNTWSDFLQNHDDKDQAKTKLDHTQTVVHLPMIICTPTEDFPSMSERRDVYDKIFDAADFYSVQISRSYEELRQESEFNQGHKKTDSWYKLSPDEFRVHLSVEDQIPLAKRGVMKKSLLNLKIPEICIWEDDSKKDLRLETQTDDIDSWVKLDEGRESFNCLEEWHKLLSWKTLDNNPYFTEAFEEIGHMTLFHQLFNLELIVREVAYNMARNPKDVGQSRTFIMKKIPQRNIYIIIRTTRMAGYDDSPCHYFIIYHGAETSNFIFEKTYPMVSGWHRTDFISLNRRKLEHLQGILAQSISLLGLMTEQLSGGLHPWKQEKLWTSWRPFRMCLLILLEDKDNTSQNLQQLRYYYMQLFSGTPGSKQLSCKIISKLTPNIRTRLMLHIYKGLISAHYKIPDKITKMESGEQAIHENPDIDFETEVLLAPIDTPFYFKIFGPDEMLLASYLCMLHNKNEANYGHGAVQMMEKVCKRQYQRADFCHSDQDYSQFAIEGAPNPDDLKEFQHSVGAISSAATLFKKKLCVIHGWEEENWDKVLEKEICKFILRTSLEDMATTKSTTIPYDSKMTVTKDSIEEKGLGSRTKCIEQMLNLVDDMSSNSLALNIDVILKGIEENEENRIQVSLFKKNQIGGVREIYVLTMRGRLIIRVFSDIFRCLCSLHPSEKLTGDKTKDMFIAEHFSRVRSEEAEGFSTAKISGDMTNWAQLFSLYEFMDMSRVVLPKCFHNFAFWVLSLHRRKTLLLPEKLLSMFFDNPGSTLSTESVDRLKKGFLNGSDPIIDQFGSCIHSRSDMMQGILHYPSSLYHILHLEYLAAAVRTIAPKGTIAKVSFEVSSDDEGILISYLGEKNLCQKAVWGLQKVWPRLKHSIDKLFGVRTSFEKSTFSSTELFEFNSKFYVGNSVTSPLVKFVARACDDNPQESITRRVAAMYSQLRQLRENGGSGYLCEWVSCCQSLSFDMNLGLMTMPWMTIEVFQDLLKERITPLGFMAISPAMIAGLTDGVYANWVSCQNQPESIKLLYHLGNYGTPVDSDDLDSAMYTMYPIKKYEALKNRCGLNNIQRSTFVDLSIMKRLMMRSQTIEDSKLKIEYQLLDPSIAASLSWLSRTDVTRMTPYFAYSAMFRDRMIGYKMSISSLKKAIAEKADKSLPIEYLFPMHRQFSLIDLHLSQPMSYVPLTKKRRLKYQWIDPSFTIGEHTQQLKEVLLEVWWGRAQRHLSRNQVISFWRLIKKDIPFMMETPEQTLSESPFDTYSQLLGYIESVAGSVRPIKLLARGYTNKSGLGMEVLFKTNMSPYSLFYFKDEDYILKQEALHYYQSGMAPIVSPILSVQVSKLEDYCKGWYEILSNCPEQSQSEMYDLFLRKCKERYNDLHFPDVLESKTRSESLDQFLLRFKLMVGQIDLNEYSRKSQNFTIWMQPDDYSHGRYSQSGSFIRKRYGSLTRVKPVKGGVEVICEGEEFHARQMIRDRKIVRLSIGKVIIPKLYASHLVYYKNQRLIALMSKESKELWYMSLPDARPNFDHVQRDDESLLEAWLSRENPEAADRGRFVAELNARTPVAVAIAEICKKTLRSKTTLRISERLGVNKSRQKNVSDFELLDIFDTFDTSLEVETEDWEGNVFDSFVNMGLDDLYESLQGLESFSIESNLTSIELNPCLRGFLGFISAMQLQPVEFRSTEIARFSEYFE